MSYMLHGLPSVISKPNKIINIFCGEIIVCIAFLSNLFLKGDNKEYVNSVEFTSQELVEAFLVTFRSVDFCHYCQLRSKALNSCFSVQNMFHGDLLGFIHIKKETTYLVRIH